jgi:phosphonate transport system substrate-binding protein
MTLCFALPPSLGAQNVRTLAREFAGVLYEAGFSTVVPINSYELLERSLLNGEVHAAWGPPMVCARIEEAGGAVVLRALRNGSDSYRSALLCRSQDDLRVEELGRKDRRRLRAVWVDQHSMAGHLMPRHHLRSLGIDLAQAFESESFLGSYEACFDAVIECRADITASYANARGIGYVELCKDEAYHLRTCAYTAECPNDGVVVSPSAKGLEHDIRGRLTRLLSMSAHRGIFCAALGVDDMDEPPAKTYVGLLRLQGR